MHLYPEIKEYRNVKYFPKNSQARKILANGIYEFNKEYGNDLYVQAIYYGGIIDTSNFDSRVNDMFENFAIIDYNKNEDRYNILNRDSITNYINKGIIDSTKVLELYNTIEKNAKETEYRAKVWIVDKNTGQRYYVVNSISENGEFISGSLFLTTVKILSNPEPKIYNAIRPNTNHAYVPLAWYIFTPYVKIHANFYVEALCENNKIIKCNQALNPTWGTGFFASALILNKEDNCEDPIITNKGNRCEFIYRYGLCTGIKNIECASSNKIKFTGVGGREEEGYVKIYDDCYNRPYGIKVEVGK